MRIHVAGFVCLGLLACGGGGDPGPRPLSHHFDDMHIAAVPIAEKQSVIEAQNAYATAKMERAKAEADYNESATKLSVAENEREQALLAEKSARTEKKAADDSNDLTRINAAAAELHRAELARKAADEKVSWLKVYREYLKKWLRYTEEAMYAAEAKYELAKARIAQKKNIRPKGFDPAVFETQYKERSERAQRARAQAMQIKQKADAKKKQWEAMVKAAQPKPATQPKPAATGGNTSGS